MFFIFHLFFIEILQSKYFIILSLLFFPHGLSRLESSKGRRQDLKLSLSVGKAHPSVTSALLYLKDERMFQPDKGSTSSRGPARVNMDKSCVWNFALWWNLQNFNTLNNECILHMENRRLFLKIWKLRFSLFVCCNGLLTSPVLCWFFYHGYS